MHLLVSHNCHMYPERSPYKCIKVSYRLKQIFHHMQHQNQQILICNHFSPIHHIFVLKMNNIHICELEQPHDDTVHIFLLGHHSNKQFKMAATKLPLLTVFAGGFKMKISVAAVPCIGIHPMLSLLFSVTSNLKWWLQYAIVCIMPQNRSIV